MPQYSTAQAAKKLGLSLMTLNRYIAAKKITVPPITEVGPVRVRLWSEEDIERIREALPTIQNGRKTRHKKNRKLRKKK